LGSKIAEVKVKSYSSVRGLGDCNPKFAMLFEMSLSGSPYSTNLLLS